jgi:hypothetical protein
MSTLSVATVKSQSSSAPVFQNSSGVEKGTLCLAWCNWNGDQSAASAIRDSFNVTSLTSIASGKWQINFTNALPNNDYAFSGSSAQADEDNDNPCFCFPLQHDSQYLTTSVRVKTGYHTHQSSNISIANRSFTSVAIFGDS